MSELPSQQELHELLQYDAETGDLSWRYRDIKWFQTDKIKNPKRAHAIWNARFSGKMALSTTGDAGRKQGYLLFKMQKAHRVIWKMAHGEEPTTIDHIDGDPSNNRLSNLRHVSTSGNMKNIAIRSDNKTGHHGVHFDKSRGLYVAYFTSEGKRKHLGRFKTSDEAAAVRLAASNDNGFHENHGRSAA